MRLDGSELNPGIIGPNVAAARRRKGLNQTELAGRIGVSRPTLVAIEIGQRAPTANVLACLADALGTQVRDLVTLPAADEAAIVRFRNPLKGNEPAQEAVNALIDFGRYYKTLESRAGTRTNYRLVEPLSVVHLHMESIDHAAENLATAERARFNLGDGPILDLRSVLEQDAGMLIFGLRELSKTKIAGLFVFALDVPLVAFNIAQRDARRQNWTLAHEYAHFLTNRYDAEITFEDTGRKPRDRSELFAESFAAHFLMPATGVSRRFLSLSVGRRTRRSLISSC